MKKDDCISIRFVSGNTISVLFGDYVALVINYTGDTARVVANGLENEDITIEEDILYKNGNKTKGVLFKFKKK